MNDTHLRAAFPVPFEPPTLDTKIDRALAAHTQGRRVRRRVFIGAAATASLALAFIAGPAVQAQAALSGIVHALDRQLRVRVTTFGVDEAGRRWPSATTTIANGDVASVDVKGTRQTYDVGDKTYDLDPTIGRFVVGPRRPGGSIRLSDLLSGASGFSLGKRARVERIDGLLRATILNKGLPERYVIDADPRTELPVRMRVDALERGAWRTRQESSFDYGASVATIRPDLKRYPATTRRGADAAFERTMAEKELGALSFHKGRLVVRTVDVAQDGTVFVAYQAGGQTPHSWNGFALDVVGDGGVRYLRHGQIMTDQEGPFGEDGKLEVEMFVPARPIPPTEPRSFVVTALRMPDGQLGRKTILSLTDHGKTVWRGLVLNGWPIKDPFPPASKLLRRDAARPTCGASPAWLSRLDRTSFGNPIAAESTKAHVRAQAALDAGDWPEAETWLDEELRLKREHERRGYGPWDLSRALEDLDRARRALDRGAMGGSSQP